MQKVRKTLGAVVVCGLVLTTGAFAAPREQDGPRAQPREAPKQQKAQKPPKGLIAAILDYVENQLTLPPG